MIPWTMVAWLPSLVAEEQAGRRRAERNLNRQQSLSSQQTDELRQEIAVLQVQLRNSAASMQQIEALRAESANMSSELSATKAQLAATQAELLRERQQRVEAKQLSKTLDLRRSAEVDSEGSPAASWWGSSTAASTACNPLHDTNAGQATSPGSTTHSIGSYVSKAEHLRILGTRLAALQQELLRDQQQRIDVVEQDWRSRLAAKVAEVENLKEAELQRVDARLQLELMKNAQASKDCAQLREWLQEAKATNQALAARAEGADQQAAALRKQLSWHTTHIDETSQLVSMERVKLSNLMSKITSLAQQPSASPRSAFQSMEECLTQLDALLGVGGTAGQPHEDNHAGQPRSDKQPHSTGAKGSRVEELAGALATLHRELRSAAAQLHQSQADLMAANSSKEQLVAEKSDLQRKLSGFEDTLQKLREEHTELQAKHTVLEAQAHTVAEVQALQDQLKSLTDSKSALQCQVDDLQKSNVDLRQQVQHLSQQGGGTSPRVNDAGPEKISLSEHKRRMDDAAGAWNTDRENLVDELQTLQSTIGMQAERLAQMEELQQAVEELQATRADADHAVVQLTEIRDALLVELQSKDREVQDVREGITQAQQQIVRLQEKAALSNQRADVVQSETISVLRTALQQLQSLLAGTVVGLRKAQQALKQVAQEEMQQGMTACQQLLEAAHQRFTEAQAERERALREELEKAQQDHSTAAGTAAQLEQELASLQQGHMRAHAVLQQLADSSTQLLHADAMGGTRLAAGAPGSSAANSMNMLEALVETVQVATQQLCAALQREQQQCLWAVEQQKRTEEEVGVVLGMRDALVSALAHELELPPSLQQELRSSDRAAFQHGLQELCELVWRQGQAAGYCAVIGSESKALQQQLEQREQAVKALEQRLEAAGNAYKQCLHEWRAACVSCASKALQQGMQPLLEEVNSMKACLMDLTALHEADVSEMQQQADEFVKEQQTLALRALQDVEGKALSLQAALGSQFERAEVLSDRVGELQADKERAAQVEQRRIQRQAEEVDALTDRIRALEAREKEKEGQLQQLRRSNMQSQRSLMGSQTNIGSEPGRLGKGEGSPGTDFVGVFTPHNSLASQQD